MNRTVTQALEVAEFMCPDFSGIVRRPLHYGDTLPRTPSDVWIPGAAPVDSFDYHHVTSASRRRRDEIAVRADHVWYRERVDDTVTNEADVAGNVVRAITLLQDAAHLGDDRVDLRCRQLPRPVGTADAQAMRDGPLAAGVQLASVAEQDSNQNHDRQPADSTRLHETPPYCPCSGAGKYATIRPRLVPSQISPPTRMAAVDAANPSIRGCRKIRRTSSVRGSMTATFDVSSGVP